MLFLLLLSNLLLLLTLLLVTHSLTCLLVITNQFVRKQWINFRQFQPGGVILALTVDKTIFRTVDFWKILINGDYKDKGTKRPPRQFIYAILALYCNIVGRFSLEFLRARTHIQRHRTFSDD